MPNWFVVRDDAEQGPLSSEQLRKLVIAGQVRPDDLLRREDISKPLRAGAVKGLFDKEEAMAGRRPEPARLEAATAANIPPIQHSALKASSDSAEPSMPATARSPSAAELAQPTAVSKPVAQNSMGKRALIHSARLAGALGKDLLAAARFAKVKVKSASTQRSSLRKAYAALGAHVVAEATDGKATEYADLCNQVRSLEAEIDATRAATGGTPKEGTLAERTKATAKATKNAAIRQRLELKRNELLTQLGRASFERHGEGAGSAEIVDRIVEANARIAAFEGEAQALEVAAKGRLLTPRRLAIGGGAIGCLLVLGLAMNALSRAGLGPRASSDKHDVADSGDRFGQESAPAPSDLSRQFFDEFPSSARSGQFVGKQIEVSGKRSSAVRQDDGSYAFHIETDLRGVSAKCLFSGSEARKAQASNERQFTISGKFSRILESGTLEFVDCRIVAEGKAVESRSAADLPSLDQFVTQVRESGQSTSPKGLPIHVRDKYLLRQRLGEPTNVLNSYRDRKGTHEVHDYACRDGRVILSVTYDLAGAWIYDVAVRRER